MTVAATAKRRRRQMRKDKRYKVRGAATAVAKLAPAAKKGGK